MRLLAHALPVASLALLAWFPACGPATPAAKPGLPSASVTASAGPSGSAAPPERDRFAVATESADATRLALEVLRSGGSAVDAAITAALTIGVVQPASSGLGGGGFAMVWDPKASAPTCLDFRETGPKGLRASELRERPAKEERAGVMVGVPGEVAGLFALHAKFGKKAFAELVRGPAELADGGFEVSRHLARTLRLTEKWALSTASYALFRLEGKLVDEGVRVKNPALAATLRRIGAEGKDAFYKGTIADDVVATARAAQSPLTVAELADYQPVERAPVRLEWSGYEVVTMPPPSAGGILLAQALRMHERAALERLGYASPAYVHLLAETMRGSVADRVRAVGDPAFVKVDVDGLIAAERMRARRLRIQDGATSTPERFPLRESGTTHVVVVDDEGGIASLTSTINNVFGSKLATKGGFLLNDELDDFAPESLERRFGVSGGPNQPRPGARPVSSMVPTVVLRGGKPVLALGASGGMRIATGVTQVLLAHLVFGRPVAQAVADPRFDVPPDGGLSLDSDFDPSLATELARVGETPATRVNLSAVQAISLSEGGGVRVLEAGADPRKGGLGAVE